jgi:hypothetical protein
MDLLLPPLLAHRLPPKTAIAESQMQGAAFVPEWDRDVYPCVTSRMLPWYIDENDRPFVAEEVIRRIPAKRPR